MTEEDRKELFDNNMRLAYRMANMKRDWFSVPGDAESLALEGLWSAARSYDESYRCAFSTYAYHKIKSRLWDGARAILLDRKKPHVSLESFRDSKGRMIWEPVSDYTDRRSAEEMWFDLRRARNRIPIRYRIWAYLHYVCGMDQIEIGELFGVTKSTIHLGTKRVGLAMAEFIRIQNKEEVA